jgi:AcrR family transcriptional regulator
MTARSASAPAAARPGGRSARVRAAVLQAAFDVLVEAGYDAMTLPEVARRAGVHPATVYRRWKTKPGLLAEAMLDLTAQLAPLPDTGSLRGDLEQLLTGTITVLDLQPTRALLAALATAVDPDPDVTRARDEFWALRLDHARTIVDRAIARGELPRRTDPESLLELLVGPAYLRALVTGRPRDHALVTSTVEHVIAAHRQL